MEIETLCENPWLELKVMRDPANGVGGYVYSHEKRCGGEIVAILPVRPCADLWGNPGGVEFMLRHEITPCWGMAPAISAITGGVEGKSLIDTVIEELYEEAGLVATEGLIVDLGSCRGTKSTDTWYRLFAVNADQCKTVEATGDGSALEAMAHCEWHNDITVAVDPVAYTLHSRFFLREAQP